MSRSPFNRFWILIILARILSNFCQIYRDPSLSNRSHISPYPCPTYFLFLITDPRGTPPENPPKMAIFTGLFRDPILELPGYGTIENL
jgi:hypothetical protein